MQAWFYLPGRKNYEAKKEHVPFWVSSGFRRSLREKASLTSGVARDSTRREHVNPSVVRVGHFVRAQTDSLRL